MPQITGDEPGPTDTARRAIARLRELAARTEWPIAADILEHVETLEREHAATPAQNDELLPHHPEQTRTPPGSRSANPDDNRHDERTRTR